MSVLVLGSIALDDVKTPSGVKKNMLGGSASHFAMSARLFDDVHMAGVIGKDFPKVHMEFLKRKGINTSSVIKLDGKTFHWAGEYKADDLNTAITHDTQIGVLADYVPSIEEVQKKIPYVFLANLAPNVQEKFLSLTQKPKFVGLDTMNLWINTALRDLKRLIKKVNMFILNDGEAKMLSGERNAIAASRVIYKMGPKVVVIKKGEHGVYVYGGKFEFALPAFPIERVLDPTGAGDSFAGALFGFVAKTKKTDEKTLRKAVMYACVVASFQVQGFGMGKTAPLTMREVDARMKQYQQFCAIS